MNKSLFCGYLQPKPHYSPLAQCHKAIYIYFSWGGGGVFTFKQLISSSLKHDTVPRVSNLYCFFMKRSPPNRIALWDCASSELGYPVNSASYPLNNWDQALLVYHHVRSTRENLSIIVSSNVHRFFFFWCFNEVGIYQISFKFLVPHPISDPIHCKSFVLASKERKFFWKT